MTAFQNSETGRLCVPQFEYPWPPACSEHAEELEYEMQRWAYAQGLILNDQHRLRVERTKYAWLAARCYPKANRLLLRTIADYFVWYFLADDFFVDRVDVSTPATLANLTAVIDVLDFNRVGPKPVFGEKAWLDICSRFRSQLPAEHFARFAHGMRMWASAAALQILNHLYPESVGIGQYETIRRHTSGMNPCLDLADIANRGAVSSFEFHQDTVQQLRLHANNVVGWSNDIQSLEVEMQQPGQRWNMVAIYAASGHSLQESIDFTAARVRSELLEFIRLSDAVDEDASEELRGYITGMKYWMRGYQDWVELDTQRYSNAFVHVDCDDRILAHSHIASVDRSNN